MCQCCFLWKMAEVQIGMKASLKFVKPSQIWLITDCVATGKILGKENIRWWLKHTNPQGCEKVVWTWDDGHSLLIILKMIVEHFNFGSPTRSRPHHCCTRTDTFYFACPLENEVTVGQFTLHSESHWGHIAWPSAWTCEVQTNEWVSSLGLNRF